MDICPRNEEPLTASDIFNRSLKTLKRNSPEIFTGLGVAGVVTTSYLTAKASFKAVQPLEELKKEQPFRNRREYFIRSVQETWVLYIPPVISGAATIACIIGSQRASGRRTSAAVAAYSITERAFSEYKDHVIEQFGKGKEQKIRDELAQKKITDNPPNSQILMLGKGEVLCCELWTGRYFKSDMESLRKAENDINQMVVNTYWVTMSDFYDLLNLDHTSESDNLGWDTDKLLELEFSTTMSPEGEPCLAFDYKHLRASDRKIL